MKVIVTMELTLPQDGEKLALLAEMSGVKLVAAAAPALAVHAPAVAQVLTAEPKPRKARKPKGEIGEGTGADEARAETSAPAGDPLMQAEVAPTNVLAGEMKGAAAAVAAVFSMPVLTEDQSLDRAKELAKLIVEAYPEKEAGTNRPKGFRLAMELLAKHKVARTTDLIHSQRLQFIAEGDAILKAAPAGVA